MLTYIGGYHILYAVYQAGLKSEMRSFLQKNRSNTNYGTHLVLKSNNGKITDDRFEWEEEGEEFRYNQELYDIVTLEVHQGYTIICCLKDNAENQLENQLEEIRKTEKKTKTTQSHQQIKMFSAFCISYERHEIFYSQESISKYSNFSSEILIRSSEIFLPPPQC
jgi:flagellar biosynthesis component FlhA